MNYGYRRNVWGLRPLGIITSVVSLGIAVGIGYGRYQRTGAVSEPIMGAAPLSFVLLLLWLFRFTKEWVRIPAEAYAHRLLETIDGMGSKAATAKSSA